MRECLPDQGIRYAEAALTECGQTRFLLEQSKEVQGTSVLTLRQERASQVSWRCSVGWLKEHGQTLDLDVVKVGPEIVIH